MKKILPDAQQLADAYRLLKRSEQNQRIVEDVLARQDDFKITVPEDLEQRVRGYLEANPAETWDAAIEAIVEEADERQQPGGARAPRAARKAPAGRWGRGMSPPENLATDDPHSYTVLRAVYPREALLTKVFTQDQKVD